MDEEQERLFDGVVRLLPPLLTTLQVLARAGRHLHPPDLPDIVAAVAPFREPLAEARQAFLLLEFPEHLQKFAAALTGTANNVMKGLDGLRDAASHSQPVVAAYSALRFQSRALEALYPLAEMLPPVSTFFLGEGQQDDPLLLSRLAQPRRPDIDTGVFHVANASTERGGFSLYVPEYADREHPLPVIFALHGGSGHGRGFLWTWLREARTHGAILVSPTSIDRTWSLMAPDQDVENLLQMLAFVRERYLIREDRLLLTGMSDGGTFSYVSGLADSSPFTHLAPIAASFHPMLLEMSSSQRLTGLPVFITHGVLDWMFDVDMARAAAHTLQTAGAHVRYEEVDDLSHTYPVEMNEEIMQWFLAP